MIPELKKNAESKMQKTLESLRGDLLKIRTGRAHTGLLPVAWTDSLLSAMRPTMSKFT